MSDKIICVSGGFDPVHIGHLRMIQEASKYGHVVVIVNSDDWLMRKKGYIFMPFNERCEILEGFEATGETTNVDDRDGTVCDAIRRIKPTYFDDEIQPTRVEILQGGDIPKNAGEY